ncbi:MAG: DedA family protein [Candidatus Aenigmarchaeota archaeon]|nr:DedA family protein [Candidatus Aenigmarchaeota archaeon]
MAWLQNITEWSKETFLPLGWLGLFLLAFAESSFFPVPPDILLIPLCLAVPKFALLYALISTVGSVLGACFGYWIGLKGGRPILKKFTSNKVERIEYYFQKYGAWAVGIAGFTPIPYKIFTIASGVFKIDFRKMIFASIISRGGRFFLEAVFIMLFGEQIIWFIENYFGLFSLLVVLGLIVVWYLWKKVKKKL